MNTKPSSVLYKIAESTQKRVAIARSRVPMESLVDAWDADQRRPHDFRSLFARSGLQVIAEVKLASPSNGDIAPQLKPLEVASAYLSHGAAALSVLTEPVYFKGCLEYLKGIRAANPGAYLLQKDFIIDAYQLYEAALSGADAILLIVALLGEDETLSLMQAAESLGLAALVEVHNEAELSIAHRVGARLIGINNRNLNDLSISLDVSYKLLKERAPGVRMICESGLETHEDLLRLKEAGADGFLVGTSLMKTGQPGPALARLLHGPR